MMRRAAVGTAAVPLALYAGYESSPPGLKRSVDFWRKLGPTLVEYQFIKRTTDPQEVDELLKAFHGRTSAKALGIILSLGGIYVKLGQVISTLGQGLFEEQYMSALAPLQDGVPPRPMDQVRGIIEASVGRPMEELFQSFDPQPVGAASIAQAHRATLADGREVIVKVRGEPPPLRQNLRRPNPGPPSPPPLEKHATKLPSGHHSPTYPPGPVPRGGGPLRRRL